MKALTAEQFDEKFDNGEDISMYLDLTKAVRLKDIDQLSTKTKKVNVEFPEWLLDTLDREAHKIGVSRQSVIKLWVAERLKAI
ncbi:type II toxin-antitoxin system BrnA family antitoxin [Sulfuricurvum sp.]|uniref:type II toxin-antitoxin system BrnA family antitoxin n=1 Tax=Sulfuricurvum sp. TaxID=2025608 RepID=UPI00286E7821|nr:CopG family antitoxin [Sulfuricurvum sp.]